MDKRTKLFFYFGLFVVSLILMYTIGKISTLIAVLPLIGAWISVLAITETFDRLKYGRSFWNRTKKEKHYLIIGTFLFSLLLDVFGMWGTRTWYYPPGSILAYLLLAPPAYVLYSKLLFLVYETVEKKYTLKEKKVSKKFYSKIMNAELILGISLFLVSIGYILYATKSFDNSILALNKSEDVRIALWYTPAYLFGLTFLFEYISYIEEKMTLTYRLIQGNFKPLASSIVASFIVLILTEIINAPIDIWKFPASAWPLGNTQLFGIPVLVYVVWPLQFPAILSLLRVIFPSEDKIW